MTVSSSSNRRFFLVILTLLAVSAASLGVFYLIYQDGTENKAEAAIAEQELARAHVEPLVSRRAGETDALLERMRKAAEVPTGPDWQSITIKPGDTLMKAVTGAGARRTDAHYAIQELAKLTDMRRLKPGQVLSLRFAADDKSALQEIRLRENQEREVIVTRTDTAEGKVNFAGEENLTEFDLRLAIASAEITDSLFLAAQKAEIPTQALFELIRIFSYDVDFQREIQPGDRFEIVYEKYVDESGNTVKPGNVLKGTLILRGTPKTFYRYHPLGEKRVDYFDDKGQSAKRALMRTPIDGARISSGFGRRRHPILGYTKMHKGVDFAARTGTPIMAAGDGVIQRYSWNGGYGRFAQIRHANGYSTAYAHMSKFRRGLKVGSRVKQGQVIGYVGTSGRSTGPHLHYEVRKNNRQINPLRIKMPTGIRLKGKRLAAFKSHVDILGEQLAHLPSEPQTVPGPQATVQKDGDTPIKNASGDK